MSLAPLIRWINLICILLSTQVNAADFPALRLATQILPPYQILYNGDIKGLAVERVKCSLNAMGNDYEIHMTTLSKAQLNTETGGYDGFFVASSNAARARYATASDPIIVDKLMWFMSQSILLDPNDTNNALKARYSAKFSTSKWLKLKRDGYNVVKKPQNAASLLDMLLAGDVDIALEYKLVFEHYMKERGVDKIQLRDVGFKEKQLKVHFSNRFLQSRPAFLSSFNEQLKYCMDL